MQFLPRLPACLPACLPSRFFFHPQAVSVFAFGFHNGDRFMIALVK
jgi:hypothetical protein